MEYDAKQSIDYHSCRFDNVYICEYHLPYAVTPYAGEEC